MGGAGEELRRAAGLAGRGRGLRGWGRGARGRLAVLPPLGSLLPYVSKPPSASKAETYTKDASPLWAFQEYKTVSLEKVQRR